MPDDSAASTTRRVSIGRWSDAVTDSRRGGRAITGDTGFCTCTTPITDADIGARTIAGVTTDTDDDELCWRCHRPIAEE